MALTDTEIRAAKPQATPYKLYDEKGLLLIVRVSGGKLWRFKYRYLGKEQLLSLGSYPDVSLKEARERRDEARKLLSVGTNPSAERKREAEAKLMEAANSFSAVAEEVIDLMRRQGRAPATLAKARWQLSRLEPAIGARPISQIRGFEIRAVLTKLEARGNLEAARQVRTFASRVFNYGIASSVCREDPAAALKGLIVAPTVTSHPGITDPLKVGALLRAIDGFEGQPSTHHALKLAPHVFARPCELRTMEWDELDLDHAYWCIPAHKAKMRKEHHIPLSRQALAIINAMDPISGNGKFVFPGIRTGSRPISENTLNAALRRLGYDRSEMTSHGFRTTASTLLNESQLWGSDVIERALAHGKKNKDGNSDRVRAAYDKSEFWPTRVKMAQWWSDHLDALRTDLTSAAPRLSFRDRVGAQSEVLEPQHLSG